jgi:hypothetical protein
MFLHAYPVCALSVLYRVCLPLPARSGHLPKLIRPDKAASFKSLHLNRPLRKGATTSAQKWAVQIQL